MSTNDDEVKHECKYLGDHQRAVQGPSDNRSLSPSAAFARTVVLEVLDGKTGRIHATQHFQSRSSERDFDIFDLEYVIRNGRCIAGGTFCPEFRNHKYRFRGDIDGTDFDAVFALSADHDFIRAPLVVLVTGCFRTKTGKRKKTF